MQIERIGFTPLKGGRHVEHPDVELAPAGPMGDRVLCLVDPGRERVLRTVDHPALPACCRVVGRGTAPGRAGRYGRRGCARADRPAATRSTTGGARSRSRCSAGSGAGCSPRWSAGRCCSGGPSAPATWSTAAAVSLVTTASLADLSRRVGAARRGTRASGRPSSSRRMNRSRSRLDRSRGHGRLRRGAGMRRRTPLRGGRPRPGFRRARPRCPEAPSQVMVEPREKSCFGVDAEVVRPGRVATGDALVVGGVGV